MKVPPSYYVNEVSENSNKIIGDVEPENFIKEIDNYVCRYFNGKAKYKILENIAFETVKANTEEGLFLLHNKDTIELVEKTKKVSHGYIYNSAFYETKLLFTWKLIPFENVLSEIKPEPSIDVNTIEEIEETEQIVKFDFDVNNNSSFLVVGNERGGKLGVIQYLIDNLNTNDRFTSKMLIISPDVMMSQYFSDKYPEALITSKYDNDLIMNFSNYDNGCVIINCSLPKKNFKSFLRQKENFKIPTIIVTDDLASIRREYLSAFEYIMLTGDITEANKMSAWEIFASEYSDYNEFINAYTQCTQNNSAMILFNR